MLPGNSWGVACSSSGASSSDGSGLAPGITLAEQRPPVSIQWLPSAADVLQALAALGCTTGGGAAAAASRARCKSKAAGSQQQQQSPAPEAMDVDGQQQQQQQYRYSHLPLLLQLLAHLCHGHAAGRLDLSCLVREVGRFRELLLALLTLMMDQQAAVVCRCVQGQGTARPHTA